MNLTEIKNVLRLKLQTTLGRRSFSKMSQAYQNSPYQKEEAKPTETVDDLMLRDDEAEGDPEDRSRTASSVRDIASRIPESRSAIGRDISRTIERAISAKDDYVVAVKVSPEAQDKLEQLVQAGVFRSRPETARFPICQGIKNQTALF